MLHYMEADQEETGLKGILPIEQYIRSENREVRNHLGQFPLGQMS